MAVLSREDFLSSIQAKIGEDTSDESLKFIEDMTDTFDDFTNKVSDQTDWKEKYEENDAEWRKKYSERFFSSENNGEQNNGLQDEPTTPLTFEDLFNM